MFKLCAVKRNTVLQASRVLPQPVGSLGKPLPTTHLTLKTVVMELCSTSSQSAWSSLPALVFKPQVLSHFDPGTGKDSKRQSPARACLGYIRFGRDSDTHKGGPAFDPAGTTHTQKQMAQYCSTVMQYGRTAVLVPPYRRETI